VGEVGSDTGGVDDIVQSELIDKRGELQKQGQGLGRWLSASTANQDMVETNLSNATRGAGND